MGVDIATNLGAVLVGAGIVWVVIRAKFAEVKDLRDEVTHLRDKELEGVRESVREVRGELKGVKREGCNVGRTVETKLDNLLGWMKRVDGKLDRYAEETAGQREKIGATERWLKNLDDAHNAHARDRSIHHE